MDVIKFCNQVQFKSIFGRIFRKSPKFQAAEKLTAVLSAAIKNDEKVPVPEDKVPLLDPLLDSISYLTDDVAFLTDEVQAVKSTLKKAQVAKKDSVV